MSESLATAELIDPNTGEISAAAPMTTPRAAPAGVALLDGRVLIIGGFLTDGASVDTAEDYAPSSATKPAP
jgi:hypothetical protein